MIIHIFCSGENESLEMIDLSWNHFRGRSALDLVDGITVCVNLLKLLHHYHAPIIIKSIIIIPRNSATLYLSNKQANSTVRIDYLSY